MGQGYSYKCRKCGNKYNIMPGSGMMFPEEYRETVARIRSGEYGAEWKERFSEKEYTAVNAERALYLCSCGAFQIEPNLSLYEPADPEGLKKVQFGEKTVEEWGDIPYMTWELKKYLKYTAAYSHKCPECGKRMHKVSENVIKDTALRCPECGEPNKPDGELLWD